MSRFFIFLCIVAYAAADVKEITDRNTELFKYNPKDVYTLPEDIDDDKPAVLFSGDVMKAKTEKFESLNGKNKFKLNLKTQNGIEVSSVGKLKDDKTFVVSGSYSFTGADGKRYRTRYTADEFGYHPITELDLDIPDPIPLGPSKKANAGSLLGLSGLKNRFQFLQQELNSEANLPHSPGEFVSAGSFSGVGSGSQGGHGADKYSGYDYHPPEIKFDAPLEPSRQYLPVQ